jgi:hypothetical protein
MKTPQEFDPLDESPFHLNRDYYSQIVSFGSYKIL